MATTYCEREDIEALIGVAAVEAATNDRRTGTLSSTEDGYVTSAIERAATDMNMRLQPQYPTLSNLTTNAWCKWCNAALAAMYLYARRGNTPPRWLIEDADDYRRLLEEIRWGQARCPEQPPEHYHTPTVSNYRPELNKHEHPIRVVVEESTGADPVDGVKRNVAGLPGPL